MVDFLTNAGLFWFVPSTRSAGNGSGVLRLLDYNDSLAGPTNANAADINFWRKFIGEFYSENGTMKYELWNSKSNDKRNFELTTALLPRFYQINFESGVQSIQMTIENAKEYALPSGGRLVECPSASLFHQFDNGCQVVAKGMLQVTFSLSTATGTLKIDMWEFHTQNYVEYIPRSAIVRRELENSPSMETKEGVKAKIKQQQMMQGESAASDGRGDWVIPDTPVNEYGITVKTMRCLEIAEVVGHMKDLIAYSVENNFGPIQSLQKYTQTCRENQARFPNQPGMIPVNPNGQPGGPSNPSGLMSIVGGVIGDGGGGVPGSPSTKKRPLPGGPNGGGPPASGAAGPGLDGAGGPVTASPTTQNRALDNGTVPVGSLNGVAGAGKAGSPQMNNTQIKSPVLGKGKNLPADTTATNANATGATNTNANANANAGNAASGTGANPPSATGGGGPPNKKAKTVPASRTRKPSTKANSTGPGAEGGSPVQQKGTVVSRRASGTDGKS
ncbi:hypothetical protein BC938DRAFT_472309 [Jimgerdemannia flammicorona]|uniref:LIM-domain binding protein-domain-containing protein n=1 Tax=Jimgerdemannia flammicorona TaxID=994334 RepID=A0A433Q6D2_9FUNG|nr:hypothetical protein BC938DRAFT_472309 [Jimgerdemannia flammicorona]